VLKLVKKGLPGSGRAFDRIVIDTAPTGHTLRLLAFPAFLNDFFDRLARLRDQVPALLVCTTIGVLG
jgi:arsenite/tail-anchored protein-transporting ATPase